MASVNWRDIAEQNRREQKIANSYFNEIDNMLEEQAVVFVHKEIEIYY